MSTFEVWEIQGLKEKHGRLEWVLVGRRGGGGDADGGAVFKRHHSPQGIQKLSLQHPCERACLRGMSKSSLSSAHCRRGFNQMIQAGLPQRTCWGCYPPIRPLYLCALVQPF